MEQDNTLFNLKDRVKYDSDEVTNDIVVKFDNKENEISRFHGMDTNINKFIKFLNSGIKQ